MIGRFIKELRRRQVFGTAVIYVVAAWVLLQVADVIQDEIAVDVRLVLIAAIVGFPIALIAGWIYDITNKGVFRTAPASAGESFDARLGAKDFALLTILAIVWAGGVYVAYVPPATDQSIAVLPFENRSHDPDSDILAFGVRDDLNVHLGRIAALRVIASSSVDQVDPSLPIDRIGAQLGVAYLLKGSVDRIADRIRINVVLIESANATQAWTGSFDRELSTEGLFDIRSGIANSITSELRTRLTETEQRGLVDRPTEVFAAWEAYVRGRHLIAQRSTESVNGAIREFEAAISLDPDFALAHAELAISIILLASGYGDMTDAQSIVEAGPYVDKAMALDPGLAEAHAATAWIFWKKERFDEALTHFQRAIEINPSYADALVWKANILQFIVGDHEEAFTAREAALRVDPLSVTANFTYVLALIQRNRLDEADQQIEKFAAINSGAAESLRITRSYIGGSWGDPILAYLRAADNEPADVSFSWSLAAVGLEDDALLLANGEDTQAISFLGDWEDAIALARAQLEQDGESADTIDNLGYALAHAGHYARALPYLEATWQRYGERFANDWWGESYLAEALVAARRDAGNEAGADQVLAALKMNVRQLRDAGISLTQWENSVDYKEGIAAYLAGERDAGLDLISAAAEEGYWIRPKAAFQQSMYAEPEFVAILEGQQDRQMRERNKVLAVVCNDNPYTAVWQPMEETCEEYFSSGTN